MDEIPLSQVFSQDKLNEVAKELHEYELHLKELYEEEVKK